MTIEEMKRMKEELGITNAELADISGVPLGTVQRVMSGETKNPRRDTWDALERALSDNGDYEDGPRRVKEVMLEYGKKQGEYTIEDYYSFADDIKVELIDGVIYDMSPAPKTYHQIVADEIRTELRQCIKKNKRDCLLMTAPDVQLDKDEKTMVQPDVVLVCDRNMVTGSCVYGAPDFICEVLSDSTRKKDMFIKSRKYMEAGVQAYWMIDLKRMKLIAYDFREDMLPEIRSLDEKATLKIYGKEQYKCEIDFGMIMDYVGDLIKM